MDKPRLQIGVQHHLKRPELIDEDYSSTAIITRGDLVAAAFYALLHD